MSREPGEVSESRFRGRARRIPLQGLEGKAGRATWRVGVPSSPPGTRQRLGETPRAIVGVMRCSCHTRYRQGPRFPCH